MTVPSERLLQDTGVATIPRSSCGRPPAELTLRMAYVDFDGAHVLAAAETLGPNRALDEEFLRRHCPRVTDAMDRVTIWLGTSTTRLCQPTRSTGHPSVPERRPALTP